MDGSSLFLLVEERLFYYNIRLRHEKRGGRSRRVSWVKPP